MIRIVSGDLFDCEEDIIAHQVNCKGAAGGLAGVLFRRYPNAFIEYKQLLESAENDKDLLGRTFLTEPQDEDGKIIGNMFGQYNPGADYRPDALYSALKECAKLAESRGYSVALPYKISCGICGGDWEEVLQLIDEAMENVDCVIYKKDDGSASGGNRPIGNVLNTKDMAEKPHFNDKPSKFMPINTDKNAEKYLRRPIFGEHGLDF